MQHPCQHCGYESPASARFCRQCGASLLAETEVSTATTRNYGRQESSVAAASSGHLPPSVVDVLAGETERYYQPPPRPAPPIANTAPIKSKRRIWRWLLLPVILFIGMAFGAMLASLNDHDEQPLPPAEQARRQDEEEERQRQREMERELRDREREARDRTREAQDRVREALERSREAAEQASAAGAALPVTDAKPLDLSTYEYPSAIVGSAIRIPGHEMLTQRTSDRIEDVSGFYQKKLGKPILQINEPWEKRVIFQSNTAPPISVTVEKDEQHQEQLKIVVLRSPFRTLKRDEMPNPK